MFSYIYRSLGERWIILFILLIFNLLFFFDILVISRLKIFLFLILVFSVYIESLNYLKNYIKEHLFSHYENKFRELKRHKKENIEKIEEEKKNDEFLQKNLKKIKKLFNILLIIYNYNNIILFLISRIEIKFFFIMRRINLFFIDYLWVSKLIYFLFYSMLIAPIKLIFSFYYNFLRKFLEKSLVEIFFKRFDGLIISLIFTSYLIDYFLLYFKLFLIMINLNEKFWFIYLLLLFYFIILIFIIINEYILDLNIFNNNIRKRIENYNYKGWSFLFDLYMFYTNNSSLTYIFFKRANVTFLGITLQYLLKFFIVINEKIKLNDYYLFLIDFKIHDFASLSTHPELKDICQKEEFFYYNLKIRIYSIIYSVVRIFKEFKNKPFMHFYEYELRKKMYDSEIQKIIYGMLKYENDKEIVDKLKYYFKREEEIFKYILFLMWDIEKYLGYEKNYVSALYRYKYDNLDDYENLIRKIEKFDVDLIKNLKKNNEKFLDIEDDFDKYVNIYLKIRKLGLEDNKEMNFFFEFIEEHKINITDLYEYGKLEIEKKEGEPPRFIREVDSSKMMPILKIMEGFLGKWREEWEKEWKEGKRGFLKINC